MTTPASVIRTSERGAELGRLSGEARRKKKELQEAAREVVAAYRAEPVDEAALEQDALRACQAIVQRVIAGDVPIRNGGEAAQLISALHRVARLEAGLSTANTAHAVLDGGRDVKIGDLRERLDTLEHSYTIDAPN